MSPQQQAACLADVNKVIAHASVAAAGKVRLEPAWSDPASGEQFGSSWVAEVRVCRAGSYRVLMLEAEDYGRDPEAWCELLDIELRREAGRP